MRPSPLARRNLFQPLLDLKRAAWNEPTEPRSTMGDRRLFRVARRAMNCRFEISFPVSVGTAAHAEAVAALDEIDAVERLLSYYRPDSDVSRLNRAASGEPVPLSAFAFELLLLARAVHAQTEGAYDVTATPLSECWGFLHGHPTRPDPTALQAARAHVGMESLELNASDRTARFRQPGRQLDFNSLGKGFALDRAAALLEERGHRHVLLQGGGSSAVALGRPTSGTSGWQIALRHPLSRGRHLAQFRLSEGGFSTSGGEEQSFLFDGKRYCHLLDPRTGMPAEGLWSASVAAPSGALAEALSTAFFVGGVDVARSYCETHPEVSALLVPAAADGQVGAPLVIGFASTELEVQP